METIQQTESGFFSMPRFMNLMKTDFIINRSNYIKLAVSVLGCFIALAIITSIYTIPEINSISSNENFSQEIIKAKCKYQREITLTTALTFGVWIFCMGLTVFGSLTFSNMSSKRERISTLMTPASSFEKYLLRMLVYGVGGTLTLVAGFILMLLIMQLSFGVADSLWSKIDTIFSNKDYLSVATIFILAAYAGWATYTLGSALWPKLSWLKTWIAVMVIQWVFGIFAILGLTSVIDMSYLFRLLTDIEDYIIGIVITGEIIVIAAFCLLAWLRFRKAQIVQRFMKN